MEASYNNTQNPKCQGGFTKFTHELKNKMKNAQLKMAERYLLLHLLSYSDGKGKPAWPKLETLASECGVTVKTVRRLIQGLVVGGFIAIHNVKSSGQYCHHEYHFLVCNQKLGFPSIVLPEVKMTTVKFHQAAYNMEDTPPHPKRSKPIPKKATPPEVKMTITTSQNDHKPEVKMTTKQEQFKLEPTNQIKSIPIDTKMSNQVGWLAGKKEGEGEGEGEGEKPKSTHTLPTSPLSEPTQAKMPKKNPLTGENDQPAFYGWLVRKNYFSPVKSFKIKHPSTDVERALEVYRGDQTELGLLPTVGLDAVVAMDNPVGAYLDRLRNPTKYPWLIEKCAVEFKRHQNYYRQFLNNEKQKLNGDKIYEERKAALANTPMTKRNIVAEHYALMEIEKLKND